MDYLDDLNFFELHRIKSTCFQFVRVGPEKHVNMLWNLKKKDSNMNLFKFRFKMKLPSLLRGKQNELLNVKTAFLLSILKMLHFNK